MSLAFLATAIFGAWYINHMYKLRQQGLLSEFGATMVRHLGNEQKMATAIKTFRMKLGPGKFRGEMFKAYLVAMAADIPLGVNAITNTSATMCLMRLPVAAAAKILESTADALQTKPSVLAKLTFVAERAMPKASSMAKLRTRFPTWSLSTVTVLQRAMLEDMYRGMCEDADGNVADSSTLKVRPLTVQQHQTDCMCVVWLSCVWAWDTCVWHAHVQMRLSVSICTHVVQLDLVPSYLLRTTYYYSQLTTSHYSLLAA